MNKFHINPETGRVNICRATVKECPVSGQENHYETKAEAYAAREQSLTAELGTFAAPVKKEVEAPKPQYSKEETAERDRAINVIWENYLYEDKDDARLERIARRQAYDAEKTERYVALLKDVKASIRAEMAKEKAEAQEKYDALVEETIANTSEDKPRKGAIIAIRDGKDVRLMKVASARGGKVYGNTVKDGELYEPLYMDGIPEANIYNKYTPREKGALRSEAAWKNIPGEGRFKSIRDKEGNELGSIQHREGVYILGAKDAATGKMIRFEENQFAFPEEATNYLDDWSKKNPNVKLKA